MRETLQFSSCENYKNYLNQKPAIQEKGVKGVGLEEREEPNLYPQCYLEMNSG